MDVELTRLRHLCKRVDDAFQEVMSEPQSDSNIAAYEYARQQLNDYMKRIKGQPRSDSDAKVD